MSYLKAIRNLLNHIIIRLNCFRVILLLILFINILFLINGQPKIIFQSHSNISQLSSVQHVQPKTIFPSHSNISEPSSVQHVQPKTIFPSHSNISRLSSVQHVQPLECLSDSNQTEWPRPVRIDNKPDDYLTVVIVTARPEFNRLPTTLAALVCHLDVRRITEVLFLVPPQDVHLLEPYLSTEQAKYWPWSVRIQSDDILLHHSQTSSYRLQMMFKLVLAQIIKTEYYLILDSDCVAVWPIHVEHLLFNENHNSSSYKAVYQIEDKSTHATWWPVSEELLQTKLEACISTKLASSSQRIGVTPIILSRTIVLRALCRLQKLYGDAHFLNKMALFQLQNSRGMWTEYTLYYITARCTQIFDKYHVHHKTLTSSNSLPALNLYGLSIWSDRDWTSKNRNRLIKLISTGLNWRRKEVTEANGQAIIDRSVNMHSLFSVLQARHGVDPKEYHQLFYPIYIQYLQQQHQTEKLITILHEMSKKLITE